MNPGLSLLAGLLAALLLTACATVRPVDTRAASPARARCLTDDPRAGMLGDQPLFFLFCVQSP